MIRPLRAGEAFLADVRAAGGGLGLWWVGQSGFLVAWRGRHLLLDPYLSDSLTRKYADTDKPHVRMTERVVDPAQLGLVDVVTASHAHTDHLDPGTLRALVAARPDVELVVPEAHRDLAAERAGIARERPLGIDDGEVVGAGGFAFTAVPGAHEAIEHDGQGRMLHLGYVVRCGPHALYHAGDTVAYDGMAERVRAAAGPGGIDVALLPINGRTYFRERAGLVGNMDARDAVALATAAGASILVPIHWDLFEGNTEWPGRAVDAAVEADAPLHVVTLRRGVPWAP